MADKKKKSTTKARKPNQNDFTNYGKLRNLAFVPQASAEYVYFSLLRDKWDEQRSYRPPEEYFEKAEETATKGETYLRNYPRGLNPEDEKFKTTLKHIQDILNLAIEKYKTNELLYFQRKIEEMKSSKLFTDEEISEFSSRLTALKDDYNEEDIIILYNQILQGKDNTASIFNFEKKHLEELENRLKKTLKQFKNQVKNGDFNFAKKDNETDDEFEQRLTEKFNRARENMYLNTHTTTTPSKTEGIISTFQQIIANQFSDGLETADVKIAHVITETLQKVIRKPKIFKQIRDNVQQTININPKSPNFFSCEQDIQDLLIQEISRTCVQEISGILTDQIDSEDIVDKFINRMNNSAPLSAADIIVPVKNYGLSGHNLNIFNGKTDSAEGLTTALDTLIKTVNSHFFNPKDFPEWQETYDFLMWKKNKEPTSLQFLEHFRHSLINKLEADQKKYEAANKNSKKKNWTEHNKAAHSHAITLSKKVNGKDTTISIPIYIIYSGKKVRIKTFETIRNFDKIKDKVQAFDPGLANMLEQFMKQLYNSDGDGGIGAIQNLLNRNLANQLKTIINNNNNMYNILKIGLQKIKVTVTGPGESEIKAAFQAMDSETIFHTGPINVKDDIVIIAAVDVGSVTQQIRVDTANLFQKKIPELDDILLDAEKEITKATDNFTKSIEDMLVKNARQDNYDYSKYETDFNENRKNTLKEIEKIYNDLLQQFSTQIRGAKQREKLKNQLLQLRQQWVDNFNNTIYRSDTMKTFNTYQNDIGFVGGSLGADISEQIDTINKFFTAAGVPLSPAQKKWLVTAAINCFPHSLIGEEQKDFIENFLGTLVIFGMFNEATIELKQLQEQIKGKMSTENNPKFLHLYGLNSIYYPGSYVLTQIKNNLDPIFNELSTITQKQEHQNIKLVNPINENIIPNKRGNLTDVHPWQTVRDIAKNEVSLNIVFLAGLIDVLKNLTNKINNPFAA